LKDTLTREYRELTTPGFVNELFAEVSSFSELWPSVPLPSGFQALADTNDISAELTQVISRMSYWIDMVNDTNRQIEMGTIMTARPWLDLESVLAYLEMDKSGLNPSSERLICLSLFCLGVDMMRRFRSSGIFFRMLAEQIEAVHRYKPETGAQRRLRIWATIVGAASSVDGTPLGDRGRSVVDVAVRSHDPDVSWTNVDNIVHGFFWYACAMETWKACWLSGLERWENSIAAESD
jgi:hypothetical protein